MSGVIFNGIEMGTDEDPDCYVERLYEDNGTNVSNSEDSDNDTDDHKPLIHWQRPQCTHITETQKEGHTKITVEQRPLEFPPDRNETYTKVMLGTYDCDMDEHDAAVDAFNNTFKTTEKGSNGSKGHYWTHAETVYDLTELKQLNEVYKFNLNYMVAGTVKVYISFLKLNHQEQKKVDEFKKLLKTFKVQTIANRYIEVNERDQYTKLMMHNYIESERSYNHQFPTSKKPIKKGDVLFNNSSPHLKYIYFWQVVNIKNDIIRCKPLEPIITIKHQKGDDKVLLLKYIKNRFITNYIKDAYLDRDYYNTKYMFDNYIYYVVN
jgi:hypothetical protein